MKIITHIVRFLVGALFIISGLIKLNDPIGFSFKLEEYFEANVLDIPFLVPFALQVALFVVIVEVILGVTLLIGFLKKTTLWSLLLMIVFFTFLTFYSAYFNKVTDCGCFGDALKLTPWESFTKDIVLLLLIIWLFINQKFIKPIFSTKINGLVTIISLVLCVYMGYYVLNHLPLKDFRAYKVGSNIEKGMEVPAGAQKSEFEMVFVYKVNGVDTEIPYDDVMAGKVPENAEFVDRKDKLIKQGYVPPVHDFTLEFEGNDYTTEILQMPKVVFFVSYDLSKANAEGLSKLEALHQKALAKNYFVIGLTASGPESIQAVKEKHKLTFDYYFCDSTTLKTIERANPSIVVLEKGTITQKKHFKDIEDVTLK
uniref:BT_3928 family protein n=1 Tax=Flavobacterium sp. TaxID=239 RepID=UPI00404AF91C